MAAARHLGPALHIDHSLHIRSRRPGQEFFWKQRTGGWHFDPFSTRIEQATTFLAPAVIDPGGRVEGAGHDINHNVGQQRVLTMRAF